jgi:hypothetical protein
VFLTNDALVYGIVTFSGLLQSRERRKKFVSDITLRTELLVLENRRIERLLNERGVLLSDEQLSATARAARALTKEAEEAGNFDGMRLEDEAAAIMSLTCLPQSTIHHSVGEAVCLEDTPFVAGAGFSGPYTTWAQHLIADPVAREPMHDMDPKR